MRLSDEIRHGAREGTNSIARHLERGVVVELLVFPFVSVFSNVQHDVVAAAALEDDVVIEFALATATPQRNATYSKAARGTGRSVGARGAGGGGASHRRMGAYLAVFQIIIVAKSSAVNVAVEPGIVLVNVLALQRRSTRDESVHSTAAVGDSLTRIGVASPSTSSTATSTGPW